MNSYPDVTPRASKIILANQPRLLRGMLKRALQRVPGLCVVEEIVDIANIPGAIERKSANWVIVSFPVNGEIPDAIHALLTAHPHIGVLAIATDGSQAKIMWKEPQIKEVNPSLNELIAILRQPVGNSTKHLDLRSHPAS